MTASVQNTTSGQFDIAIIGLGGRWPDAEGPAAFWTLIRDGREAIRPFTDDELRRRGVPAERLIDPTYVKAGAVLADIDAFAASFFGYAPREAALLDPQHRVFLECAWEAMEDAGYPPLHVGRPAAVFAATGLSTYLLCNLVGNPAVDDREEAFQAMIGTDKDFLASRVSYKLNLTGPSLTVQTGCSSSLVAVSVAVQSLLTYQCDMALAGGVAIAVPQRTGYWFQAGGIASPDGHCRPFSADAAGTVFGDGAGIVVLKRLAEAIADRDHVYAVIRGAAINNDGSAKVGYTAPSVAGQCDVVRRAVALADVSAETIGYVEAHGTATGLGDPAEVAALTQAFDYPNGGSNYCAIGSVKANVGHLDAAAGVTGLIKTVLMLERGMLPPSLHCAVTNPRIEFAATPFYVNTELAKWPLRKAPRRAGVSSFGIGGTNAHVILEEAPPLPAMIGSAHVQVVTISAQTPAALETATDRLAAHLEATPNLALGDVAFTTLVGREQFRHRRAVVCETVAAAAAALRCRDRERVYSSEIGGELPEVVFMFPGGGAQHARMGRDLYRREPVFRVTIDRCIEHLRSPASVMLRRLTEATGGESLTDDAVMPLALALPAIFSVSYATAQLLIAAGVRPAAMIGHSLGEYVAACLAGVLTLDDALDVVALRGRLIDTLPRGAMLSVYASESELAAFPLGAVSVAAINAADTVVLSGSDDAIDRAAALLDAAGVECRRVHINAAAHSSAVEPIVEPLRTHLRRVPLQPPAIPYISNLTGTWATAEDAADPEYWVRHLRNPVQFAAGIAELARHPRAVFVEVGPGRALSSLVRGVLRARAGHPVPAVVATMNHAREQRSEEQAWCEALARLWLVGAPVDWTAVCREHGGRRVSLPTYPFERDRFWIDPPQLSQDSPRPAAVRQDPDDWCWVPTWIQVPPLRSSEIAAADRAAVWLLLADRLGVAEELRARLVASGAEVVVVRPGQGELRLDGASWSVDAASPTHARALLEALPRRGQAPLRVIHLWSLAEEERRHSFEQTQRSGLLGLLTLIQAAAHGGTSVDVLVVTNAVEQVGGSDRIDPANATLRAAALVVPQEVAGVRCRVLDVVATGERATVLRLADQVLAECVWPATPSLAAYRGYMRWAKSFRPWRSSGDGAGTGLRQDAVIAIVGGTGQLGPRLAIALARWSRCRLALIGRGTTARVPPSGAAPTLESALETIAASGSTAAVFAADCADAAQMYAVLADVERRWGPVTGIVHLAGLTGEAALQSVTEITDADLTAQYHPKVHGARVLLDWAASRPLDFVLMFSSTASVLGGVGMLPYAAANTFLDALATAQISSATRWLSVGWDSWLAGEHATYAASTALTRHAIQPDAALEMLHRLLSGTLRGHVVVSTGDVDARIADWVGRPAEPRAIGARPQLAVDYAAPRTPLEKLVAAIWADLLGLERIGIDDNLFELGGNSLIAIRIVAHLKRKTGQVVPVTALFEAPTVQKLAAFMEAAGVESGSGAAVPPGAGDLRSERMPAPEGRVTEPAGLRAAADADQQACRHLQAIAHSDHACARPGKFAIVGMAGRFPGADSTDALWQRLSRGDELIERCAAATRQPTVGGGHYVSASAMVQGYDLFDADFFGMTPADAALRDPQHRLLLEACWVALEHAGYGCRRRPQRIGVFAGATTNTYLTHHLAARADIMAQFDPVQINAANGLDFLTTFVSYKLNLTGPSHAVQSACSTSLVALHAACRSIADGECDMAIAGGVSVNLLLADGYAYREGGIFSADGLCRAFDADASGTVFGSGVGAVLVKRLEDAQRDGDLIHAVVLGSAVNNDGGVKPGYAAPSVDGEAAVVERALAAAGVGPDDVSYVECHGTGTLLGDPIELRALTKAFRTGTPRQRYCAVGSVKTNVGHLDAAAGVTGLIKVVESLKQKTLVPSLHCQTPNPEIDWETSPFYVNTETRPWPLAGSARRAGVSAFGIGGTNAHVVVEEAPTRRRSSESRPWQLIVWSGRTAAALTAATVALAEYLKRPGVAPLADVAYTLQTGRQRWSWRHALTCRTEAEACDALADWMADAQQAQAFADSGPLVFVFPSEHAHVPGRGAELYAHERVYRVAIDRCADVVADELGVDLRKVLFSADPRGTDSVLMPAMVVTSAYALAELWLSWGVRPALVFGQGVTEYAAACVAGLWPIQTAMQLALARGRLMDSRPSGESSTSSLRALVEAAPRTALRLPYVSAMTGRLATDVELQSPEYWQRQATAPMLLDGAVRTALAGGPRLLLQLGSSDAVLAAAASPHRAFIVASRPDPGQSETAAILTALGQLWTAGVDIDWTGFYADEQRHRVPLPTYPFQRTRCWIDRPAETLTAASPPTLKPLTASRAETATERPAIAANRPPLRTPYIPPRGATEAAIVEIVEAGLGIRPIGVNDRFGELGGDSLQAVRIVDAINTRLACHLKVVDLFDDVTARTLARRIVDPDGRDERAPFASVCDGEVGSP